MPDWIESELVRVIAKHCSPERHEEIPEPDASSAARFHTLQDVYDAIASAKPASA